MTNSCKTKSIEHRPWSQVMAGMKYSLFYKCFPETVIKASIIWTHKIVQNWQKSRFLHYFVFSRVFRKKRVIFEPKNRAIRIMTHDFDNFGSEFYPFLPYGSQKLRFREKQIFAKSKFAVGRAKKWRFWTIFIIFMIENPKILILVKLCSCLLLFFWVFWQLFSD